VKKKSCPTPKKKAPYKDVFLRFVFKFSPPPSNSPPPPPTFQLLIPTQKCLFGKNRLN